MTAHLSLRFVELFAGVAGLGRGLENAGHVCVAHAEIASFPRRVLAARYPHVPLLGDVCELHGADLVRDYGPIDLLAGGSPCQGLSGAGLRLGLDDPRSILFYQQVRIWEEINAAQDSDCLLLWENVDGARSSHEGKDFGCVLSSLVGAACAAPADGWQRAGVAAGTTGVAAWRLLDAQFFGVPQRRARVFVVGTRGGSIDPAEVLSLGEGVPRYPSARRQAREGVARRAPAGARSDGGHALALDGDVADDHALVFDWQNSPSQGMACRSESDDSLRASAVPAVLAFSAKDSGNDVTVDVSPTLRAGTARSGSNDNGGVMPAVFAFDTQQITSAANRSRCVPDGPAPSLADASRMHVAGVVPLQDITKGTRMERDRTTGTGIGEINDPMYTLLAGTQHGDAVLSGADEEHPGEGDHHVACVTGDVTHALTCEGADASEDGTGRGAPIVARKVAFGDYVEDAVSGALCARDERGSEDLVIGTMNGLRAWSAQTAADVPIRSDGYGRPRRLMPVECERLMSWPDGWTGVPSEGGKPAADGPRYRACGNGVASVQAEWIGWQLATVCAAALALELEGLEGGEAA